MNNELLRIEQENGLGSTPDAIELNATTGKIDSMKMGHIYKSSLSTDGIDFSARYNFETSFGDFSPTNVSKVMTFKKSLILSQNHFITTVYKITQILSQI